MVNHVATPGDAVECAGAKLLMKPIGMQFGIDNAIVRAGNEMHRDVYVPIKPTERPGGLQQPSGFLVNRLHLRHACGELPLGIPF